MWVCYFPFPSLHIPCKRIFIITMIRVICDLTLLQYRQKPFMLTYLEIYKVKSFKTIRKFCTINDILCIHLMPQLSRLVVYRLYRYRNCLYRQRDSGIRLSISCSLRHYQFSINAIGDFNAQDYGLLEQKQTTWHLFHKGIRKCPIGFENIYF